MKWAVPIIDRNTNEVAVKEDDWPEAKFGYVEVGGVMCPEGFIYLWSNGGNYSCDCNRSLFFHRVLGRDEPEDIACGESRYYVPFAENERGERVLLDADSFDGAEPGHNAPAGRKE